MESWSDTETHPSDRRGSDRAEMLSALGALLECVRRDGALGALAIADATGILVAGAGPHRRCEQMAALAPLAANDTVPTWLDVIARKMQVRRLRIDGIEVLLSAEGGDEGALARAAAGCARILGDHSRRTD
jgi:hypothetical protein